MESIVESMGRLLAVEGDHDIVDAFAREKFYEKFRGKGSSCSGFEYRGFHVLSEGQLRIDYIHWWGDMESADSFTVEIQ